MAGAQVDRGDESRVLASRHGHVPEQLHANLDRQVLVIDRPGDHHLSMIVAADD
ncbi:hypothetical protein GWI34_17535 [Actinomadura sp. DSM 109109]|nr:hypothetical protein [Actinomadura lepetitiana]